MGKQAAKSPRQKLAVNDQKQSRYAAKAVGNDDYRLDEFFPTEAQQEIVRSMVWNDLTIINGALS